MKQWWWICWAWEKGMLGLMERALEGIGQVILQMKMVVIQNVISVGLTMVANVQLTVGSQLKDGVYLFKFINSLFNSTIQLNLL